ncbi:MULTISPECIES: O-antigen ligase family protein [Mesorhizobium]|uniref:O-antigen ligase family protein n=1 Tax=Mesorhizobium sp. TaxID=1871066 RepID=UPI000494CD92|nr:MULTISPECIES: O-antigen ligase family protein [Mesorhizobium]RWM70966.1 MAG: polymerase [Mesorhizobium sp.]TIO26868.1 MAG: polymerase [Mesorhizobium sp.]TJV60305.1 MAG: polymerase [Mesorhizobium sp.]
MIRDAILACGLATTYAVQLDIPGLPLGVGELFLVLWMMLSVGRVLAGGRLETTPALTRLASFWTIMALSLGVGAVVGYLTTTLYLTGVVHDTMAYLLLASITCLAAAEPDADRHLRRTAWWVVAIANASFAIQLGLGWGWIHQSGVDPWYWDRFRGWSENPNQLALYCALFGPLALHLATTTSSPWGRLLGLGSLVLTIYVGRLTKSDTFLFTTILTCLIFLALRFRTWLTTGSGKVSISRQVALLSMVGFLPLAMSMTPYVLTEVSGIENFAKSFTKDQGGEATAKTAALRFYLWEDALGKGLTSGSLGLGPGPHLDTPAVAYNQFLPRPFEAHNTILDLYTQGGLVAVAALLWIVGSAAMSAWRAKLDALLALVVSIVVFGMPHLIIRHPIVWFALTICIVAGTPRADSATSRELG